jgi:transposase
MTSRIKDLSDDDDDRKQACQAASRTWEKYYREILHQEYKAGRAHVLRVQNIDVIQNG